MSDRCPECSGTMEDTVISGVVSVKRRRSLLASGKVSGLRSLTCRSCGLTRLYAERPERLFPESRGR